MKRQRDPAVETIYERVDRLIGQAIRSGQFTNQQEVIEAADLTSGWLANVRKRCAKDPNAKMHLGSAKKLAQALGVSLEEITGGTGPTTDVVDLYESRARAVAAARLLRFPEAAIRSVLAENPPHDPGDIYWFRRIEAESERARGGGGEALRFVHPDRARQRRESTVRPVSTDAETGSEHLPPTSRRPRK